MGFQGQIVQVKSSHIYVRWQLTHTVKPMTEMILWHLQQSPAFMWSKKYSRREPCQCLDILTWRQLHQIASHEQLEIGIGLSLLSDSTVLS